MYEGSSYQRPRPNGKLARFFSRSKKNGDLLANLKKAEEIMKKHIDFFTKLAEQYYDAGENVDYTRYTGEDVQVAHALLYALLKYKDNDTIIPLGSGKFNEAVFTRKDIPELRGFSHGRFPLFVVQGGEEDENKEKNPKKYLNDHTVIYSPKGGDASEHKQGTNINYGYGHIMHFPQAIEELKDAYIHKVFPSKTAFENFVTLMKEIKKLPPEGFKKWMNRKDEYYANPDQRELNKRELYEKTKSCLLNMSGDSLEETIYALVQSFDLHKEKFNPVTNPYAQS